MRIQKVASKYTEEQIGQYLACIGWPKSDTVPSLEPDLENLRLLVRLHLLKFPFENTEMHYTPEHIADIRPEALFNRLVVKGYGSVCFGHNILFLEIIRGLEYRAYGGAARVNQGDLTPVFSSLQHQINFVQFAPDQIYMVDVGWGHPGLVSPILLSSDPSNVIPGAAFPECHRLTRWSQADSATSNQVWCLEVRYPPQPWRVVYQFSETEYFITDFDVWTFAGSTRPPSNNGIWTKNPFTQYLLCIRHVPVEGGELGRLFLFQNEVKRHIGDRTEVVTVLNNEEERLTALHDLFGIKIDPADIVHMAGRPPAFKAKL